MIKKIRLIFILIFLLFSYSLAYGNNIEIRGSGGKLKGNKSFENLNKITKLKKSYNKIKNKTTLSDSLKNEENFFKRISNCEKKRV